MKLDNFLPVNRGLQKHWIFKDSSYLHCWLEMLFNARFSEEPKTDVYKGVLYTINRGEFLYSRPTYSERLSITDRKLRTLIKLLIADNMITEVKSLGLNKPTIYKINNYEVYNIRPSERVENESVECYSDQVESKSSPSGDQVASKSRPLKNKDNKVNNGKKDNNTLVMEVLDFYNSVENVPKYRTITDGRKKAINARIKEYGVDTVKYIISQAADSEFLVSNLNSNWYNFDWIFNPNNFAKIYEGKYNKSINNKNDDQYGPSKPVGFNTWPIEDKMKWLSENGGI